MTVDNHLRSIAPDLPESPAAVALAGLQKSAGGDLPQDGAELFTVLLAKTQDESEGLLAICGAVTVDVVVQGGRPVNNPARNLRMLWGPDMAAWWQPTAFQHIS